MTDEQAAFALNHNLMFGDAPFIKRMGGKYWIDGVGLSQPSPFKTRHDASVRLRTVMASLRDRVRGVTRRLEQEA